MLFLSFQIVTLSDLIESRGKMEGESSGLSEIMASDLRRVGSEKDGVVKGLLGESVIGGEVIL